MKNGKTTIEDLIELGEVEISPFYSDKIGDLTGIYPKKVRFIPEGVLYHLKDRCLAVKRWTNTNRKELILILSNSEEWCNKI